uniref:Antennal gustatory receptor 9 n=1 Tax=Dendrolimus punctatus TaxID=238572 RepID=A0A2K8GKY2_9NEOP|nr:antennal gustatory receptor 9 [Dendrolimus punctatus]
MLTEQVAYINSMYGIRILLNSLSLLIDMVRFTNLGVRLLIGSQRTINESGYFPAFSSLLHLLTCVAVLISLVEHCEQTYSQRVRIIRFIDHLLINKNPDDDLRSAVNELRELVQDRPVTFNMANFFTLNYSLLISIASVVVTYTIILLQSVK